VSFLKADCRTSLPLKPHFKYTRKIKEMYPRHAETRLLEDELALDHASRSVAVDSGWSLAAFSLCWIARSPSRC
jgi:hypothetical protein